MRFQNKKIFITGASRGIGRAIARAFRTDGAWVIGTWTGGPDANDDSCQEWFAADFRDREQIVRCAEFLRSREPDILVNNAGCNKNSPFVTIDADTFLSIHQVNVFAPLLLCQAAIPAMKRNHWGRIINISSIWGKISMSHRAAYSASKFALDGMTVALAAEHTVDGILANCIAPGFFDTELTQRMLGKEGIRERIANVPAQRLGQVDEISRLVLWLASDENTFVAGQNIAIDGGFTRV
ncbi:MAG: SDR family oxidoreductase [Magnetococcales bacterium]|nr:SDR family oxidoreductase [Magnetococcales bacterium]MBF0110705.1 SDR family oxidoreductase [Magnetococcales bacterium]MBF0116758.1 SDR family oxidoreductase [Magnetococcales bacterium]